MFYGIKRLLAPIMSLFMQVASELKILLKRAICLFNKENTSQLKKDLKNEVGKAAKKAKDLYSTNLKLGLFHFYKGNLADARMRFSMLKTLYRGKPLPFYNLARCKLLEGEYQAAKSLFKKAIKIGKFDYPESRFFIDLIDKKTVNFLPKFIAKERFEYLAENYVENFLIGRKYSGHKLIADEVEDFFGKENAKNISALDLGCGTGVCCHFLKMLDMCKTAHGVDISTNMLAIAKKCMIDDKLVLDKIYQDDIISFLEQKIEYNYDVIIAADSLGYVGEISGIIAKCRERLARGGTIMVIVRFCQDHDLKFDPVKCSFSYSVDYLRRVALENNLEISSRRCKIESSVDGVLARYTKYQ